MQPDNPYQLTQRELYCNDKFISGYYSTTEHIVPLTPPEQLRVSDALLKHFGNYVMPVPPVDVSRWGFYDWIKYIEMNKLQRV